MKEISVPTLIELSVCGSWPLACEKGAPEILKVRNYRVVINRSRRNIGESGFFPEMSHQLHPSGAIPYIGRDDAFRRRSLHCAKGEGSIPMTEVGS
jgi:hypothetical protein